MLATSPFHHPSSSPPFASLPPRPSPLSPRCANIHGQRASMPTAPKPHADGQENAHANSHIPFSKRAVKKAPSPKQDDLKERRRKIFLDKVKQGREDRRYESRGEDIMRLDFMRARRNWEASLALGAPVLPSDPAEPEEGEEEDAYDLPTSSANAMQTSQPSTQLPVLKEAEEEEVDEMAQMEDRELQALLEMMPENGTGGTEKKGQGQNLWSDDDDYEELFSELMERDDIAATQEQPRSSTQQVGEAMDIS